MADPITAGLILGLAVEKFAGGMASAIGKKLVDQLWDKLAQRFKGRKKPNEWLAQIEASRGQAIDAQDDFVRVLDGELLQDDDFRDQIEAIVRQLQAQEPKAVMDVLVGVKGKNIRAKDITAEMTGGGQMRVAADLEAEEDIELGNISAKQLG